MEHGKKEANQRTGGLTQEEIAAIFGISKARVQQLEKRALNKLATRMRADPQMRALARELGHDV